VGLRLSEEYRPTSYGSAISRVTPYQQDPTAMALRRQAELTDAKAERDYDRASSLITDPVEAYGKQRDREFDRAAKEKQIQLAEEQRAGASLNRGLEEQFGARQRQAQVTSLEGQSEYQRMLADRAKSEEAILSRTDGTGKTLRERSLEAPITQAEKSIENDTKRLALDAENSRIAAQTAAQQRELGALQISQLKNAEATKALIGRVQYAKSPQEKQFILDAAIKSGNPTVAYDAVSQLKDGEQRAEMTKLIMAQSDPAYRAKFESSMSARNEQREVQAALAELQSLETQLRAAPAGSSEAEQVGIRASQIAAKYGLVNDARDLQSAWNFESANLGEFQNPIVTRTEKLAAVRRNVAAEAANAIERKYPDIDGIADWSKKVREQAWQNADRMNASNIFDPKVPSNTLPIPTAPVTPAQYFGGQQAPVVQQTPIQQPPPQFQQQPMQRQSTQAPPVVDPFKQFLSKGRPVQQTGGK
jgi:hypothetical protein